MMNRNKYSIEEARLLVHRSLDEVFDQQEQQALVVVLAQFPELEVERQQLEEMRQLFSQLQQPAKPGFAAQVASSVLSDHSWYRPLISSWSSVAAAACVVLALSLGFVYYNSGTLETEALLGLEDIQVDDVYAFE